MLQSGIASALDRHKHGTQAVVFDQAIAVADFDKAMLDQHLIEFAACNELKEPKGNTIQFSVARAGWRGCQVRDLAIECGAAIGIGLATCDLDTAASARSDIFFARARRTSQSGAMAIHWNRKPNGSAARSGGPTAARRRSRHHRACRCLEQCGRRVVDRRMYLKSGWGRTAATCDLALPAKTVLALQIIEG